MDDKNFSTHNPEQPVAQPPHARRKRIVIIISIILGGLVLIAGVLLSVFNRSERHAAQSNQETRIQSPGAFMQQYGNGCQDREVAFTSPPMKQEELSYIRPLGAVSDGHVTPTDHVYIGGSNPHAPDNTYAVLMPADGTVTNVGAMPAQYIGDREGQQVAAEDHRIVISHSCRFFSIYIHVHKLSDALTAAVGQLQPNENKHANVELKAGDVVGYIGGSTFDWTPIDTSVTLKGFTTPSYYEGESWKIHTVSPFDLYTGDLKAQLEAKSLRNVAPIGGKIDYDQPGRLIGNWFREGSGGYSGTGGNNEGRYWDGHLSIAPDYIDPTFTVVSIGNWTGSARQFVVSGASDPAAVSKDTGIVKYELRQLSYGSANGQTWNGSSLAKGISPRQSGPVEGAIILQVLPDEKLKIEKFPGKTASQVSEFTSAAQLYER